MKPIMMKFLINAHCKGRTLQSQSSAAKLHMGVIEGHQILVLDPLTVRRIVLDPLLYSHTHCLTTTHPDIEQKGWCCTDTHDRLF